MLLIREFASYTVVGVVLGGLYVFLALGYSLVYRVLKVVDLSYSGAIIVGMFVALQMQSWWWQSPNGWVESLIATSVTITILLIAGVIIRLLVQTAVFGPLRRLGASNLVMVIGSLGVYFILQEAMGLWKSQNLLSYTLPFSDITVVRFGNAKVSVVDAGICVVAIAVSLGVGIWLRRSRLGKSVEAVAQDPIAAQLNGVKVNVVSNVVFGITGALAGLAAVAYLFLYTNVSYDVGISLAVNGLIAALLGGMGSVTGAIAGAFAFGLIESYGGAIFGATWQDVIGYVALVILLLIAPSGLIREKRAVSRA